MTADKKQLEQLADPNTIIVVPETGFDSLVAQRWLKAHVPAAVKEQRVFTEVHPLRLQGNASVCAVFRSPERPAHNYEPDKAGITRALPRPDAELFDEIVVTKLVKVGDFWRRPSATAPGEVDTASFLEKLQAELSPLRLDYVDKGEAKPQIMKLTTL